MSIPEKQWEVRLAKHVENDLTLEHFDLVEVAVPEPGDGEVLVRVDYVSVAAAFKDFMRADCQVPGVPPWKVGDPAGAGGVGTVVKSNSPDLAVGDLVQAFGPWQEYWAGPAQQFIKQNPQYVPSPVYFLSQGPTAYYGMATIAQAGEGDVVFVTGAAGGVGSLAGQIAKARGAKVIGSAGSQAKVDWLVGELGFDAAFNYKDGPVADRLRELAPDGISVFFDNVGGEQFEAAIQAARPHARFALCGALANQAGGSEEHPRLDLMTAITKHLEIRPFACYHLPEQIQDWVVHFGQWLQEGKFVFPHTIVEGGVKTAPQALLSLLAGKYTGNVTVKFS
jgi:NADPH-dependent curcumin reductase CurA